MPEYITIYGDGMEYGNKKGEASPTQERRKRKAATGNHSISGLVMRGRESGNKIEKAPPVAARLFRCYALGRHILISASLQSILVEVESYNPKLIMILLNSGELEKFITNCSLPVPVFSKFK